MATGIVVLILGILLSGSPLLAQDSEAAQSGLTVQGEAEVRATPDVARVQLGVTRRNEEARAAQSEANGVIDGIVDALADLGISRDSIQTSELSLRPLYQDPSPRGQARSLEDLQILGYDASYTVTVRVNDLNQVGPVVDAALEAGANRLQNIYFDLEDELPVRKEALKQAVAEAIEKAEVMASAASLRLVRIRKIDESNVSVRPVMMARTMAMAEADTSTPVLPGQVTITANVILTYEIASQ